MTIEQQKALMKQALEGWKWMDEVRESERREKLPRTNTAEAIEQLDDAFESALYLHPPRQSSGLQHFRALLDRGRV